MRSKVINKIFNQVINRVFNLIYLQKTRVFHGFKTMDINILTNILNNKLCKIKMKKKKNH